jgi:gas vesicle protein
MSDRDNSSLTVLGAFVLGGLIGAGIALISAPRSGRETRNQLGSWAEGATERTRERVHNVAQETGDRVRTYSRETGDRLREAAQVARDKFRRSPDLPEEPEEI